ncbi:hypothetical protein HDU76_008538 [Blyttiomyces sp. JEL0837]|nr:hypothetical protein HDU76_008538 [Blyttiomyces sp. JEL0837]
MHPGTTNTISSQAKARPPEADENRGGVDCSAKSAATIGTTFSTGQDYWDEKEDAAEEDPVGFDAIKRWTLRVNNSTGSVMPTVAQEGTVSQRRLSMSMAAMVAADEEARVGVMESSGLDNDEMGVSGGQGTGVGGMSTSHADIGRDDLALVDVDADHEMMMLSRGQGASASHQLPMDPSEASARIDPDVLASLMATLDEQDSQAVENFLASYTGANVEFALYGYLAKIQDLRAGGEGMVLDDDMGGDKQKWDTLPIPPKEDPVLGLGGEGKSSGLEMAVLSDDAEADLWNQATEAGRSVASDFIMVEDAADGEPGLQTLPKRPLYRILMYSRNPNLLLTCRRLSRVPIPELGPQLAELVLALTMSSPWPAVTTHQTTVAGSSSAAVVPAPTVLDPWEDLLPRCARAPCVNRSPSTLPCLIRLMEERAKNASCVLSPPSISTLSAVMDIAARGRRWNTVRGALSIARMVSVPLAAGSGVSSRFDGVVPGSSSDVVPAVNTLALISGTSGSNVAGGRSMVDAAGAESEAVTVLKIGDLVEQHLRRHFVPEGDGRSDLGEISRRGAHVSMAANLVANHGAALDVAFFQDLVEEEGVLFPVEVVEHCAQNYNISPEVIEYLMNYAEKTQSYNFGKVVVPVPGLL